MNRSRSGSASLLLVVVAFQACHTSAWKGEPAGHATVSVIRRVKLGGEAPIASGFDAVGNLMVAGMYGPVRVWTFSPTGGHAEGTSPFVTEVRVRSSQILDAGLILIAQDDGTVSLWDWRRNESKFMHKFPAPFGRAAATPDGRLVASSGRVFDRQLGSEVVTPMPLVDEHALDFSDGGRYLLSAGFHDARIVVRDFDRNETDTWEAPEGIAAAAMTADAEIVAAGLRNKEIVVWRRAGKEVIARWSSPDAIESLRFSRDKRWLVVADLDGVSRFDLQMKQRAARLSLGLGRLQPVSMTEQFESAGTPTGDVVIIDLARSALIGRIHVFADGVSTVGVAPAHPLAVATDPAGNVAVISWK